MKNSISPADAYEEMSRRELSSISKEQVLQLYADEQRVNQNMRVAYLKANRRFYKVHRQLMYTRLLLLTFMPSAIALGVAIGVLAF